MPSHRQRRTTDAPETLRSVSGFRSFGPWVIVFMQAALTACGGGHSGGGTVTMTSIVADPTFTPVAGSYSTAQTVSLSTTTVGASIYFTTDGSTPTTSSTAYSAAITVGSTETLKAIAAASGETSSAVVSATYTIAPAVTSTAATPTFSVPAGTYSTAQTIAINDVTTGATIYYTTDGSTPTTASTRYTSAITVSSTETLSAIAVASGDSNSAVASGTFTISAATPPGSVALTTIASFGGSNPGGTDPVSPLVQTSNGNFYGTTRGGGANGDGTIFVISASGVLSALYSFGSNANDGSAPASGLVIGSNGNLYGTTQDGGANNHGTVFEITPNGTLSTLHAFSGTDGAQPTSLMLASNGNFYGTNATGGANGFGTIYEMTPAGAVTTVYSFSGPDGSAPLAQLVQGANGNFYGVTDAGGTGFAGSAYSGAGTVYMVTPAGALTTLYSFMGTEGAAPDQGLILGSDGNFYGTAGAGGNNYTPLSGGIYGSGDGVVFKMTPGGALTILHRFNGADGINPTAGLALGSDGNLYGSTYLGGAHSDGTLYKITPAGALTTLYSFAGADGKLPSAPLIQGSDGNFYGTTASGGTGSTQLLSSGTVFKLSVGLSSQPARIDVPQP